MIACLPASRALRAAVAASMLLAGCQSPRTFEPATPVTRLGETARPLRVADTTRPVLDPSRGVHEIRLPAGSQRVLSLAAARAAASPPRLRCRATITAGSAAPAELGAFDVAGEGWTDVRVPVPESPHPATLSLACDGGAAAVWARPLLLPAHAAEPAPLIVVLSLDTLRADHVTGFGDSPVPTPELGRVASEGTIFTAATSPFTWTLPAHFSLFTSRLYGFPAEPGSVAGLASILADHGFATAGFTGGGFVSATFHFDAGFDRYGEYDGARYGSDIAALPAVLEDARRWIEENASAPSFVFLHTYAVHELTEEERSRSILGFLPSSFHVSPQMNASARDLYRSLVAKLDATLAPLFADLRRIAAERPTLALVLSDHGEAFQEHGNFRHGSGGAKITLHDELVRIPMIFWAPGIVPAERVATWPFSLLDVAPTVLAATGIAAPAAMTGRDFWPVVRNGWDRFSAKDRSRWKDPVVSYKNFTNDSPAAWATRSDSLKRIVYRPRRPRPEELQVYDLLADPAERTSRADPKKPEELDAAVAELKQRLSELGVTAPDGEALPTCPACASKDAEAFLAGVMARGARGPTAEEPVSEETRQRLRALGYLE